MQPNDNPERRAELERVICVFGKYKGKTLGDIFDRDPLWVDFVAGFEIKKTKNFMKPFVMAVQEYIKLPVIATEIEKKMGRRSG